MKPFICAHTKYIAAKDTKRQRHNTSKKQSLLTSYYTLPNAIHTMTSSHQLSLMIAILLALTLPWTIHAFLSLQLPSQHNTKNNALTVQQRSLSFYDKHDTKKMMTTTTTTKNVQLQALIYGWDGTDSVHDTTAVSSSSTTTPSYIDLDNEWGSSSSSSCSPVGIAVAESLSYDPLRVGHLARLAVAFSPPERTLTLNQIEKVDVICVKEDSIEIQAILCEHGGCVSLQVPVKFPNMCHSSSSSTTSQSTSLEGCVMDNLDALDVTATSLIQVAEETKANHQGHDQLLLLSNDDNNNNNNVPSWWVSPSSFIINDPTTMTMECQHIQNLLNDDEFQSDIIALSQDALMLWQKQQQQQEEEEEGQQQQQHDYQVLQAKVTMVGPAGLCFKVRVQDRQQQQEYYDYYNNNNGQGRQIHVLNVVHPFGDIQQTTQELRAAVLGAVSAAEGL